MSIDGTVSLSIVANDRRTVGLNAGANIPVNEAPSFAFTNGSGALQASILYQAQLSLSGGALNVDLNGVLTDSYGTTVNCTKIKAIFIQNNSASNTMTFGDAASDPFVGLLNSTGTITLNPGDCFLAVSGTAGGFTVTAGTGDILKVAGTGTDQFSLIILSA